MMFRPTCTKETRSNNDNILRKQQEVKYSKQYMDKYNQELNQNNKNQNGIRSDIAGWVENMNNIGNNFYEYSNQNQNSNINHFQQRNTSRQINEGSRQPIGGMNEYSRLNEDTFLRSMSSSTHIPIKSNYENYQTDRYSEEINNQFEVPKNTRNIGKMKADERPIQQCFQQDYFMSNFETLNQMNKGVPMFDNNEFSNHFMNRNPVNTRRDQEEKIRTKDNSMFKSYQGGPMNSFVDLNPQYTRKERNNINSSSYVPMPRTLALPRENV